MKIIALQGTAAVGKTTTLKRMILTIIENKIFNTNIKDLNMVKRKCLSPLGDLRCVFDHNGIKIGITTRGDTRGLLEDDFKELLWDCDIVVCAVHTFGGTVDFINEKGTDGVIVHTKWFVAPQTETRKDEVNAMQSDYLIKEIQDLIKEMKP